MQNQMSQKASSIIQKDPVLSDYIRREEKKYPFPKNYIPLNIEIRIDNVPIDLNKSAQAIESQNPTLLDIRFDGECAYFDAEGIVIIDRRPLTFKQ